MNMKMKIIESFAPQKEKIMWESQNPGRMQLCRQLRNDNQISMPKLLFQRQIGLPKNQLEPTNKWLFRSLIKIRCEGHHDNDGITKAIEVLVNGDKCITNATKNASPFWFHLSFQSDTKNLFSPKHDTMIIKNIANNTRRFFTLNPYSSPVTPLKLKWTLPDESKDPLKWKGYSLWHPSSNVFATDLKSGKVVRAPTTLFVLQSLKLILYDFHNGKMLAEVDLRFSGGPTHFGFVGIDDIDDRIYIETSPQAAQAGNRKNFSEMLVLEYPPLRFIYRIIYRKGVMGPGVSDVAKWGRSLAVSKSSCIEIIALDDLIKINRNNNDEENDARYPELKTIVVTKKPAILLTIKTVKGYVRDVPLIWPPHYLVQTPKTYRVFNLEDLESPVYQHNRHNNDKEVTISVYDENSPRLHIAGLDHGFDILEFNSSKSPVYQTLFTTEDYKHTSSWTFVEDQNPSPQRVPVDKRKISKKTYRRFDNPRQFGVAYDCDLDLLSLCTVADGILYTTIFDYKDMTKEWIKLPPVKITVPKGFLKVDCSEVCVHFHKSFLSVMLKIYDDGKITERSQVYFINLTSPRNIKTDIDFKL